MTITLDLGPLLQIEDGTVSGGPNALQHNVIYPGDNYLYNVGQYLNGIVTSTGPPWPVTPGMGAMNARGFDSGAIAASLHNNPNFYDPSQPRDPDRSSNDPSNANTVSRAAHFSPQEIKDWYNNTLGRDPTDEEGYRVALLGLADAVLYLETTYLGRPIFGKEDKKKQDEWKAQFERYYGIQSMAQDIFGDELDPYQVAQWVRSGISDDQLLYSWRKTDAYQALFEGKPAYMKESEYRATMAKMSMEADKVKSAFDTYGELTDATGGRRQITDAEIKQIYLGGPGTDLLRKEYTNVMGLQASKDASVGRLTGTTVTPTPGGPTQQLLGTGAKIYSAPELPKIGQLSSGTTSDLTQVSNPVSNNIPITELFTSYKDFQAGLTNPAYREKPLNP